METVFRSKANLTVYVKERAGYAETVLVHRHKVGREPKEFRRLHAVRCGKCISRAYGLVVEIQNVDGLRMASAGDGICTEVIVNGLADHVADCSHDQSVELDGHAVLDRVEDHRDESSCLRTGRERGAKLLLNDRHLNLEGHLLVVEMSGNDRSDEYVRIVALIVLELPALVLLSLRKLAGDLLQNGTVLPAVPENGRNGTAIRAVYEYDAADVIHEGTDICVEAVVVKNSGTDIDDIAEVFLNQSRLTEHFLRYGIND